MHLRAQLAVLCAASLAMVLWRGEARACSSGPASGLGFAVLPADESEAPTTTNVWVSQEIIYPDLVPPAFTLRQRGAVVATTMHEILLADEGETRLLVLIPSSPLIAGEPAEVLRDQTVVSRFRVVPDTGTAPLLEPEVEAIRIESPYYGGFSCPEPSRVAITTADPTTILMISPAGAPAQDLPTAALAFGPGGRATAVDLDVGEQRLQVVALDLAGNLSPPHPVTVTIPPLVAGCTVSPGDRPPVLVVLVCAGWILRRRRRSR